MIRLNADGAIQAMTSDGGGYDTVGYWHAAPGSGVGTSYFVRALASGSALSQGTLNTAISLSQDQYWTSTSHINGGYQTAAVQKTTDLQLLIQNSGGTVLATVYAQLFTFASRESG